MKKIIYMLSLLAFIFAGCDTMEDTYDELEEAGVSDYVQSITYTLTEDDYDSMGEEYGEPGKYDNFSSSIAPTDYLPDFIETKFAVLDEGSDVTITYDYYLGGLDYIYDYEDLNYLQLTDDDYDSMGTAYGEPGYYNNFAYNIDPAAYLPDFLAGVYDDATSGDIVEVNFKYYSNYTTSIVSQFWAFDGSVWANASLDSYELTDDDYDSMGTDKDEPGEYNNFAYDVAVEDFMPDFLAAKYPDAVANDLVDITYDYYDGSETSTLTSYFSFDGSDWSLYEAVIVVPSGVTQYDLVDADYEEMGFEEYFDEEDDSDLIATFLEQKYPYASDDEIYCVTFKYLDDDVITRSAVQYTKTEGVWTAYESSTTKSDQYIYSTTGWVYDPSILYTLTSDDYQTIVTYVSDNFGSDYIDSYGTAEYYYGASAYYTEFVTTSSSYYNSDVFASSDEAITEAIRVWLTLTYPDAPAQIDGVDSYYIITYTGYNGSTTTYSITFQCTATGTFEYSEGPTAQ